MSIRLASRPYQSPTIDFLRRQQSFAPATSHPTMLVFSARARTLWGHAPRVRSAAAFRRGLATVADRIDAR